MASCWAMRERSTPSCSEISACWDCSSRAARSAASCARCAARSISTCALLVDARDLGLPVDLERQLLGFQVLVADGDQRVLLDVVALLLAPLDLLGQPGQALRIEGVRRIEVLHVGLIELGQRYRLELQTAARQRRRDPFPHAPGVFAALLVQLLHRHLGRNRAQGVDELALHHVAQAVRSIDAPADRLGRRGHGLRSPAPRARRSRRPRRRACGPW